MLLYIITSAVGDTCVAMDEWVQHPTAHTALDEILPCVDNATAQQTLLQSRDVARQLVILVDKIISDVTNRNLPAQAGPVYYNQSGPLMPPLCNPFNPDLTVRPCVPGEVPLDNATEVRHFLGNIIFRKYFLTFFLLGLFCFHLFNLKQNYFNIFCLQSAGGNMVLVSVLIVP